MWRSVWVIAVAGCGHIGAWQFERMPDQSISGPQPFVMLHPLGPSSADALVIECAPNGLQLAFRGRFSDDAATVQFDDAPPLTLPTSTSLRGVPVVDLRRRVAGGSSTTEELLVDASRFTLHPAAADGAAVVLYDVTHADRAIRRLHCPE